MNACLCPEFDHGTTSSQESLHLVELFSLNLVHEIEVALVELVHTDVTVFSSACVSLSGWVGCDGVLRTEC